jgi:hypothetical protein
MKTNNTLKNNNPSVFYSLGIIIATCTGIYYLWIPLFCYGLIIKNVTILMLAIVLKCIERIANQYKTQIKKKLH